MTEHPRERPSRAALPGTALCLLLALPLLICGWSLGHQHAPGQIISPQLVAVSQTILAVDPSPAPPVPAPQPGPAPAPVPTTTPNTPDPATAVPSPGPSASTAVPSAPEQENPGFFDVTGRVKAAINGWMGDLVTSALNPILRLLGRTLLATPDLTADPRLQQLWTGSQIAANAVFGLFIVAAGALVMAKDSLQTQYTIKEVAPRLLVAIVAANVSLQLIAPMIEFANAFTIAVVGNGLDPRQAGAQLTQLLVAAITSNTFMAVLGIVTAVLAVIVVLSYILRITVTILLIVSAPLFLICHALPATNPAARFWWRAIGGCLLIQLGQGITLLTAMRLFFSASGPSLLGLPADSAGLINVLVATCLLWILARIPSWVTRAVFGGGRSSVVGIVRSIVLLRGLRAIGVLRR